MIVWFIIGVTALISYIAFQNRELSAKLQFNAAQIIHRKEYYRLISHAFIHANWSHLGVNMLVLYFLAEIQWFILVITLETKQPLFLTAVLWRNSGFQYLEPHKTQEQLLLQCGWCFGCRVCRIVRHHIFPAMGTFVFICNSSHPRNSVCSRLPFLFLSDE